MINKGAESLPAKDAQAYKQLAVLLFVARNSMMPRTTKRALKTLINCLKLIPIILKHSP